MMIHLSGAVRQAIALSVALAVASPVLGAQSQSQDEARTSVKVHGHWTIDVLEPDGTLVERREFENALLSDGPKILANILARKYRAGPWFISVSGPSYNGPCGPHVFGSTFCIINEPSAIYTYPSPTLTVSAPTSGPNAGRTVLSGYTVANSTSPSPQITTVTTNQMTCLTSSQGTVDQCVTTSDSPRGNFSATTIPPLSVVNGQIIQVTVVFSFQ